MNIKQTISNFSVKKLQYQFYNLNRVQEQIVQKLSDLLNGIDENLQTIKSSTSTYQNQYSKKSQNYTNQLIYQSIDQNYLGNIYQVYKCCNTFFTKKNMIKHLSSKKHKNKKNETHFLTRLGNLVKRVDEFEILLYESNIFDQGSNNQVQQEEQLSQEWVPTKKKNTQQLKEQIQIINQKQTPKKKQMIYRCGCGKQFDQSRYYRLHMVKHYRIIPEGSSHIIYRKPEKDVYIRINDKNDEQIYKCPCNMYKKYKNNEFVKHVMKWHKGITPCVKY